MISGRKALAGGLFALVLGWLLGVSAGAAKWRKPPGDFTAKHHLIINRAKDMPPGGVLVLGDSIVERQRLETICGLPALNAGIGSARLKDLEPIVPAALETRPSRAIVAIGANDAHLKPSTDVAAFASRLDTVLTSLPPRPILVGVTDAPDLNRAIREVAARHRGSYVEPLPASLTEDGLHLSGQGLAEWKRRVQAAC